MKSFNYIIYVLLSNLLYTCYFNMSCAGYTLAVIGSQAKRNGCNKKAKCRYHTSHIQVAAVTKLAAPLHPSCAVVAAELMLCACHRVLSCGPVSTQRSVWLRQVVLDVTAEARARVRRGCVPAAFHGHLHAASVRLGDQLCGWRGTQAWGWGWDQFLSCPRQCHVLVTQQHCMAISSAQWKTAGTGM